MFIVYFSDFIQGFITLIVTKGSDSAEKAEKYFIKKKEKENSSQNCLLAQRTNLKTQQHDGENHPESITSATMSLTTRGTAAKADATSYMDASSVPRTQTTVTPAI